MRIGKLHLAGSLARLRRRPTTTEAGDDPVFETYEAAARAAFRSGTTIVPSTLGEPRNEGRPSAVIVSSNRPIVSPTATIAELGLPTALPVDGMDEVAQNGRHTRPAQTERDPMLRTPDGVAPVAEDFFDSVIRRVEGRH